MGGGRGRGKKRARGNLPGVKLGLRTEGENERGGRISGGGRVGKKKVNT